MSLETPGFLPYQHGFHHEFALMKQNKWLDTQMGLCFCEHCLKGRSAGVDARRRRSEDPRGHRGLARQRHRFPGRHGGGLLACGYASGGALKLPRLRCDAVTSLVADIRASVRRDAEVAVIPSVARPTAGAWYEGTDLGRSRSRQALSKRASTSRAWREFAPISWT